MSSSDCVSSNLTNKRYPIVPHLNLPSMPDNPTRLLPMMTTPTSMSPRFRTPYYPSASTWSNNPAHYFHRTMFSFPRQFSPSINKSASIEQEEIDQDFLQTFNIVQNNKENVTNELPILRNIVRDRKIGFLNLFFCL